MPRVNEITNDTTDAREKPLKPNDGLRNLAEGGKPVELKIVTKTKTFHLLNAKENSK